MATFHARTRIHAPVSAVAAFHHDSSALKRLTPPPLWVQLHKVEPLAEGSRSAFTLWFGPLPVRWLARHTGVRPESGFTDTQERGPLRSWVHTHRWQPLGERETLLEDTVVYEHHSGWRGLLSRLLFAPPLLKIMFAYRHAVTRRAVERGR